MKREPIMYKKAPITNNPTGINTIDIIINKIISASHFIANAMMREARYRIVVMTPKIFAFLISVLFVLFVFQLPFNLFKRLPNG